MISRRPVTTAVVLAGLAASAASCGLTRDLPSGGDTGSVAISFGVAGNLRVASFDYTIAGPGYGPVQGRIRVDDPNATLSASVGGLPPAAGYQLTLRGETDDLAWLCVAVSVFDAAAGVATSLSISMVCMSAASMGIVDVAGVPAACPALASTTVAETAGAITLSAAAFAFDQLPLAFAWQASDGVVAQPNADVTPFACGAAPTVDLRVTVSNGFCSAVGLATVACQPG
jgi:hypothetical protein